jgi:serine/threonine protein kinase/tetratricopeptide (TPR) repeat protein
MLNPGQLLGDYRIEALLGSGAVGEVYRACDTRSDRVVALKVIRAHLADSPEYQNRLRAEAAAMVRVDSPYVARAWDYSTAEGTCFLAMEYVEGREIVSATQDMDLTGKLRIAWQVAEGIQAAHAVELIHRDIKSENIKVTPEGTAKILDFGLAKEVRQDEVDESGNIVGTLWYASPEQLMGEPVTVSTDMFSFGVLLYELVTGRRPFEGEYSARVYYSILHEEPIAAREIIPDLPEWLDQLLRKLLSKRAKDRFARMSDVVEQLRSYLSGRQIALIKGVQVRRMHVTVLVLKNLSDDKSWDYFCEGFTDDLVSELSRRSELGVSVQSSHSVPADMGALCKRLRSDFVVGGSLMRWQDKIRLKLDIYGSRREQIVSSLKYEKRAEELFDLLNLATRETADILASECGKETVQVADHAGIDISAYEYYLKGKNYYQSDKPEHLAFAIQMYERALQLDPNLALAHSGVADVLIFQYMAYYDRSYEIIQRACEQAQKALLIEPSLPEGYRSLGRYYMFIGDLQNAEACLVRAVDLNPRFAIGYRTLAWLKYQQGDYGESMEWANKALQLVPTDTETLLLIGQLHTYERRYTAAMATLQRAVEIEPDYGRGYYNLGLAYHKLGVPAKALEQFRLACKYEGDPNCYVDAGWVCLLLGDCDQARRLFRMSVEKGWFPFIARYCLGFLERTCGDNQLALEYFSEVIEELKNTDFSDRENVQIQGYYAMALAGAGRFDDATTQLQNILTVEHLIGDVLLNVARSYALMGETSEAVGCIQRALVTSPGPTESEIALDPHFNNVPLTRSLPSAS